MMMTNYGVLIMGGSWVELALYMVLPMFLVETFVVLKILILLRPGRSSATLGRAATASSVAALLAVSVLTVTAGQYFLGCEIWKGWVDLAAAVSYELCIVPTLIIALNETGLLFKKTTLCTRGLITLGAVVGYLIFSHGAMFFGMTNPTQFGYENQIQDHHQQHLHLHHDHDDHGVTEVHSHHH